MPLVASCYRNRRQTSAWCMDHLAAEQTQLIERFVLFLFRLSFTRMKRTSLTFCICFISRVFVTSTLTNSSQFLRPSLCNILNQNWSLVCLKRFNNSSFGSLRNIEILGKQSLLFPRGQSLSVNNYMRNMVGLMLRKPLTLSLNIKKYL